MCIDQYAAYLNRKSMAVIASFPNNRVITNEDTNNEFRVWMKSVFGETSLEYNTIELYRSKIENLDDKIKDLGEELIKNYKSDSFTHKKDCL